MAADGNSDETVLLRPRRRRWRMAAGAVLSAIFLAGCLYAIAERTAEPGEAEIFADEAEIRAHDAAILTVFRFSPNPAILVLDFPTLAGQARMLNRLAAWAEKAGEPHDRVLTDGELADAIRTSGAAPDTYYYGHDYRGSDVVRFFALADRDHVALRPEEERLRRLATQAAGEPFGFGAIITLTRIGGQVDAKARATILHHELSHGEYFTNAAYARSVAAFWRDALTEAERGRFRAFLTAEGYDPALGDLIVNETQAYLMHTADPRFFDERALGIAPARLAALRAAFLAGMPSCWLRDVTQAAVRPRRRHGCMSRTTASPARVPPRRRKESIAA